MLDPWIIEQIRRREEEERRKNERPYLELPVPDLPRWPSRNDADEGDADRERDRDSDRDEPKRGVVIIGM
jgi:hypothetical protein